LQETDRKTEESHKGMENHILEFAKRMDARWNENEPRELLHKISSGNLNTKAQSNNAKKVIKHG